MLTVRVCSSSGSQILHQAHRAFNHPVASFYLLRQTYCKSLLWRNLPDLAASLIPVLTGGDLQDGIGTQRSTAQRGQSTTPTRSKRAAAQGARKRMNSIL